MISYIINNFRVITRTNSMSPTSVHVMIWTNDERVRHTIESEREIEHYKLLGLGITI